MEPSSLRRLGPALMIVALAPGAASAQVLDLSISHSLGNFPTTAFASVDPLVQPNTFFVVGTNTSKDLPLDVRSVNVTGTVRFSAFNIWRSSALDAPDLEVVPRVVAFQPPEQAVAELHQASISSEEASGVDFPAPYAALLDTVQYARPALRVTSPGSACPVGASTCVGRADYVALVDAKADASAATAATYAVLSIINPLNDNTAPLCRSLHVGTPDVFPLKQTVTGFFDIKAADPSRTTFTVGVTTTQSYGKNWPSIGRFFPAWEVTLSKASTPLRADEALVTFVNRTDEPRTLWTYHSPTCTNPAVNPANGPFQNIIAGPGQSGTIRINRATVSTIVLSRTNAGADFGVFAEPNFWTLFGGKQVTINNFK